MASSEEEYFYKLDEMLLISCDHLRTLFKHRWEMETGEEWTSSSARMKGKGLFKRLGKHAQTYHKTELTSKPVEDWDIALLCLVLHRFENDEQQKSENVTVLQVKKLRNHLRHRAINKISKDEYLKTVEMIRSSLKSLGMEEQATQLLIRTVDQKSSINALRFMEDLHAKADASLALGQNENALEFCTDAIKIPGLLPEHLGTAYEKRVEYFLKLIKDPLTDEDKCNQALLDASKALELNESSWRAHYLTGQCHQWENNLSKAIQHYERALAISPSQQQVKIDLENCTVYAGTQSRKDHNKEELLPKSLQERAAAYEKETGLKMTEMEYLEYKRLQGATIEGQDHAFLGQQHYCGWGVPQDFSLAVHHYIKAARLKNAEGMHCLAQCYLFGHGVKQDARKAMELFRATGEMDRNKAGQTTPLDYNLGVTSAQHALGVLYHTGNGVEAADCAEAAVWYKRAVDNGSGAAANNLACLLHAGLGVPENEKMAELYWKHSIYLKHDNASNVLMKYYCDELEPEKAVMMVRVGRKMGNHAILSMSDEKINEMIDKARSDHRLAMEQQVCAFEKEHNFDIKGLTFLQRWYRKMRIVDPWSALMVNNGTVESTNPSRKAEYFTPEMISAIQEKANAGSEIACQILTTLECANVLKDLLEKDIENTEEVKLEILNLVYSCTTMAADFASLPDSSAIKLESLFTELFERMCGEEKCERDMKIRLCFVLVNLRKKLAPRSEDNYAVELLKEGIQRYPDNVHYYRHLGHLLWRKFHYDEATFYVEEGVKRFPTNPDMLYDLASLYIPREGSSESVLKCIAAYKNFLSVAPQDHRKVPEAFYTLSYMYSKKHNHEYPDNGSVMDLVESHFKLGQEAEEKQLPCYLPYEESHCKCFIENKIRVAQGTLENPVAQNIEAERKKSVLEQKEYLKSPTRKCVIRHHRQNGANEPKFRLINEQLVEFMQRVPKNMVKMKSIPLMEMDPTMDHIYENRTLDLTIIDQLKLSNDGRDIHLIGEDENGDVTRLYICNMVDTSREMLDNFEIGCRIAIMNPFMRIGLKVFDSGIKINNPRCIVYLKKVENMCGFCGAEENGSHRCAGCTRVYCSTECMQLDLEEFHHNLSCNVKCL